MRSYEQWVPPPPKTVVDGMEKRASTERKRFSVYGLSPGPKPRRPSAGRSGARPFRLSPARGPLCPLCAPPTHGPSSGLGPPPMRPHLLRPAPSGRDAPGEGRSAQRGAGARRTCRASAENVGQARQLVLYPDRDAIIMHCQELQHHAWQSQSTAFFECYNRPVHHPTDLSAARSRPPRRMTDWLWVGTHLMCVHVHAFLGNDRGTPVEEGSLFTEWAAKLVERH